MTGAELLKIIKTDSSDDFIAMANQAPDSAFEQLALLLPNEAMNIRMRAADMMGEAGNPVAVMTLAPLLHDADARVRAQALYALTELGGYASQIGTIGDLLMRDSDAQVRSLAVEALSNLRHASADRLIEGASDDSDPRVQKAIARWREAQKFKGKPN
jgi:HEAT repeat protein